MTLGGLPEGVTVLDMAHAYESFASGGNLVYGSLSPGAEAYKDQRRQGHRARARSASSDPRARERRRQVPDRRDCSTATRPPTTSATTRVLPAGHRAHRAGRSSRASCGSARASARRSARTIMVAGKTGTTENYGDAWFVGWTPRYTVAVWVGYPDAVKAMEPPTFSFNGEPVAGGTYPAAIWGTFMRQAMAIYERRHPDADGRAQAGDVADAGRRPARAVDAARATRRRRGGAPPRPRRRADDAADAGARRRRRRRGAGAGPSRTGRAARPSRRPATPATAPRPTGDDPPRGSTGAVAGAAPSGARSRGSSRPSSARRARSRRSPSRSTRPARRLAVRARVDAASRAASRVVAPRAPGAVALVVELDDEQDARGRRRGARRSGARAARGRCARAATSGRRCLNVSWTSAISRSRARGRSGRRAKRSTFASTSSTWSATRASGWPAMRPSAAAPSLPLAGRRRCAARRRSRARSIASCRRRPRPRHVARAARAEAPRQLGRLGDADARPDRRAPAPPSPAPRRAAAPARPARSRLVVVQLDVERLGELAGPGAEVLLALAGRGARASASSAGQRLERADQHRGADALRLADDVEQRVDAVGAVDVGAARRPEQHVRARGAADVRVAGRPRTRGRPRSRRSRRSSSPCSTTQPTRSRRDLEHRPREERRLEDRRQAGWPSSSARAWASCSRTRTERGPALGDLGLQPRALRRARRSTPRRARREWRRISSSGSSDSVRPAGHRLAHEPGDDAVRLAERDAAPDEQVGDVGGGDQLVARRAGQPVAVEADALRASRSPPRSHSSSVSTVSNRPSLSSCRSLL